MSVLASFLMRTVGRASSRRFEAATRDPQATQKERLLEIVRRNQDTEYGREYGFAELRDFNAWRAKVPVIDYEDIKARMERVTRGEENVFTVEKPRMFARTSGTTGDAKFIPITDTCQGQSHKDQLRTWFYRALQDHPRLFSGKILSLVSPAVEGHAPSGVPYGSTSGQIYKKMPGVVRSIYLVPYDVFEIEDYFAKYYVIMRLGVGADLSLLATANPSTIIKLCEVADRESEHLLKDLADGTLRRDLQIHAATRALIEAELKPDPDRARKLEQARQARGGKLLPADYWPDLALIGCWKGGTVGSYLTKFPAYFDPDGGRVVPVRDWGYLSSEARCSIPITDDGCGGVLSVAANVYEFVEADALESNPQDSGAWEFLGAEQVEKGREYYIFITTTGGLYRYDINDIVEVVGHYNKTPVIEFRRKGRGMTNITGEKVSVNQIIEAFSRAGAELGVAVDHFKAEADLSDACYVFKAESIRGIPEDKRLPLLECLERSLAELNLEYKTKRDSLRLNAPRLHVMKTGWYESRKEQQARAGKRVFQAKTILLEMHEDENEATEESFVEAVVALEGRKAP